MRWSGGYFASTVLPRECRRDSLLLDAGYGVGVGASLDPTPVELVFMP